MAVRCLQCLQEEIWISWEEPRREMQHYVTEGMADESLWHWQGRLWCPKSPAVWSMSGSLMHCTDAEGVRSLSSPAHSLKRLGENFWAAFSEESQKATWWQSVSADKVTGNTHGQYANSNQQKHIARNKTKHPFNLDCCLSWQLIRRSERCLCCSQALRQAGLPFWKTACHSAKPHQGQGRAAGWYLLVRAGQEMDDGQSCQPCQLWVFVPPRKHVLRRGAPNLGTAALFPAGTSHNWSCGFIPFPQAQPASTQPTVLAIQGRTKPGACCYEHVSPPTLSRLWRKVQRWSLSQQMDWSRLH